MFHFPLTLAKDHFHIPIGVCSQIGSSYFCSHVINDKSLRIQQFMNKSDNIIQLLFSFLKQLQLTIFWRDFCRGIVNFAYHITGIVLELN